MKLAPPRLLKVLFATLAVILGGVTLGFCAEVTLTWDASTPAPDGYRVFVRQGSQAYDYAHPIWEGAPNVCTLIGFVQGVTYHFVVRAFQGNLESADSTAVTYTPAAATDAATSTSTSTSTTSTTTASATIDTDGDGVPDVLDRFPNDPTEWADNDGDGIGDNQDPDDDNDGMPDVWEIAHGLNPLVNDAALDEDGDGVSNLAEYQAGSDPAAAPGNKAPSAPSIDALTQTERVSLTPALVAGGYTDAENDAHSQSQWQISTESDFSTLVLDDTSKSLLATYTVGEMVLDVDTVYYWRVRFIDARHGVSDWSPTATFTTIAADQSDDTNMDGVPDAQAVDESVDMDGNGIPDSQEANIMSVNTVEGQAIVGVESNSENVSLVAVRSIPSATIADRSVKLGFGLVGFKLYLPEGVTTVSVTLHFSKQVPQDAKLYKYSLDNGWQVYDNAAFASNGKSVTLVVTDGGPGDEDGLANGVIVDPAGVAYSESAAVSLTDGATSGGAGGGGRNACFISSSVDGLGPLGTIVSRAAFWMALILLAAGIGFAAIRLHNNRSSKK
jgi:chitinase